MNFSFAKEQLILNWINLRKEEGMPAFNETCSVGYKKGAMLLHVPFSSNNFSETMRCHGYSFQIEGNILFETISLVGMVIHFENPINEEEKAYFTEKMIPFMGVYYWDYFSLMEHEKLFKVMKELIWENYKNVSAYSDKFILIRSEKGEVKVNFINSYLYVEGTSASCEEEFILEVVKKIKGKRMQLLFN